jgi:hypothetical protein
MELNIRLCRTEAAEVGSGTPYHKQGAILRKSQALEKRSADDLEHLARV